MYQSLRHTPPPPQVYMASPGEYQKPKLRSPGKWFLPPSNSNPSGNHSQIHPPSGHPPPTPPLPNYLLSPSHPKRLPCLPSPRPWRSPLNPSRVPQDLHPAALRRPKPPRTSLPPKHSPPPRRLSQKPQPPRPLRATSTSSRYRTASTNDPEGECRNVRSADEGNAEPRQCSPFRTIHRNLMFRKT